MRTRRRTGGGIGITLVAFSSLVGCGAESGASTTSAPPPVTESAETLAGYAQECGVELGPVPGFDCAAGHPVPVTVSGVEADAPPTCDRPSFVRSCGMPTRVGRLSGRTWDATDNPDVSWVFMCVTKESETQIVFIGQHRQTGATCFFESKVGNARTEAPPPLPEPREPATAREDFWLTPAGVAEVGCPDCHTSDPWVHSPFIDQVRDPDHPEAPLVPSGADRSRPYFAVASPFEKWPRQVALEGNACLACHRIGTGSFSSILVREATNRSRQSFASPWGKEWPQSHWMPPTGAPSLADWEATYGADVTAILECLEGPSQEHCSTAIPSSRAEPR